VQGPQTMPPDALPLKPQRQGRHVLTCDTRYTCCIDQHSRSLAYTCMSCELHLPVQVMSILHSTDAEKPRSLSKMWTLSLLPPVVIQNATPHTLTMRMTNRTSTDAVFVSVCSGSKHEVYSHSARDRALLLEMRLHEDLPAVRVPITKNASRHRQVWLAIPAHGSSHDGPDQTDFQEITCELIFDRSCGQATVLLHNPICVHNKTGIPLLVAFERGRFEYSRHQQLAPKRSVRVQSTRTLQTMSPTFTGEPGVQSRVD
jgi:hypothetical protein